MKPLKVLIVDDEKDVEFLFNQQFRKELREGLLEFHFAFSGAEALGYLRQSGVDNTVLVLSDINMPGMNGLDLLKNLKLDFPVLRVVLISAYSDDQNYELAKSLGADGFITKPVDFTVLKNEFFTTT
ncbi:MAG TPA: response regulator [Bacteroidia bacterium]|nr:response regulator [Bacteroidia bacterium]